VAARSHVFPELILYSRQNDSFTWWVVNRLLFLAAVTSIQRFAMYFLMSAFHLNRDAGIELYANLVIAVGIFTVLSALPGGWLSDRFGTRKMVAVSGLIATAGTLVLLVTTFLPSLPLMYIAGTVIGLGAGLFMTTNWAMGTDLAPAREAGRYLGVSNLAGAGAGMIGGGLGGPIADLINSYAPGLGYFVIFASYALLFLLSSASLFRIHVPVEAEAVPAD
jgi:MFS family permease